MKYPLAMVNWLLDNYGADIGLGYDIMCAFFKTLMRSSLGAKVTACACRASSLHSTDMHTTGPVR